MIKAQEALDRLVAGNRRFVESFGGSALTSPESMETLPGPQHPFAAVLGCADSRVPPEHVFHQGLGDVFSVRVAGNVVTAPLLASVEFAAHALGTRLIVVLGHSACGAVGAAVSEVAGAGGGLTPALTELVEEIRPAVEEERRDEDTGDGDDSREAWVARSVRSNVRFSMAALSESAALHGLQENDGLRIVGAEYDLATGEVDFFELPGDLSLS